MQQPVSDVLPIVSTQGHCAIWVIWVHAPCASQQPWHAPGRHAYLVALHYLLRFCSSFGPFDGLPANSCQCSLFFDLLGRLLPSNKEPDVTDVWRPYTHRRSCHIPLSDGIGHSERLGNHQDELAAEPCPQCWQYTVYMAEDVCPVFIVSSPGGCLLCILSAGEHCHACGHRGLQVGHQGNTWLACACWPVSTAAWSFTASLICAGCSWPTSG